jgi:hypothetical protein
MVACLFEELDWKKEHSDESVAHDDHDITSTERGTTSDEKEFFFSKILVLQVMITDKRGMEPCPGFVF